MKSLPHVQVTWASTYSGWIAVFIVPTSLVQRRSPAQARWRPKVRPPVVPVVPVGPVVGDSDGQLAVAVLFARLESSTTIVGSSTSVGGALDRHSGPSNTIVCV